MRYALCNSAWVADQGLSDCKVAMHPGVIAGRVMRPAPVSPVVLGHSALEGLGFPAVQAHLADRPLRHWHCTHCRTLVPGAVCFFACASARHSCGCWLGLRGCAWLILLALTTMISSASLYWFVVHGGGLVCADMQTGQSLFCMARSSGDCRDARFHSESDLHPHSLTEHTGPAIHPPVSNLRHW